MVRLGVTSASICTNIVLFTWQAKTWSKLPLPAGTSTLTRHRPAEKAIMLIWT